MIGNKLAHYEIQEKIGSGGMGEVYRARDTKLSRDVALKVLPQGMADDDERRKRFQREATAIAALKHPNIVTIHSIEEADGRHFLTMELVEGKALAELIPSDGLPLEQYFKIAVPLAEAIHNAHAAGITHRDLKPANVMLDAEGRVKVLDFGLAKLFEQSGEAVSEAETLVMDSDTQEGRVLGTVAYMSPEQAEGKSVDTRSDIFALGILLYEMATGQRPFKGDTSLSLLSSILKDTPSTVTDIRGHLPVQLGRIVQHCLEKDPRKRFQSALDVANELEALKLEVSSATGSIEAIRPSKPMLNKRVGISGAIVLVALVALLILNPWKVEVSKDQSATAAGTGTKLAIMYFENLAEPDDPKRHGEIMGELLITGLSDSEHISVVSSQRLYDILKQIGKEGVKTIDRTTATEVATRSNARWMMQGRILQTEPNYVITSQIVEVASGDVAASQRITGQPGESIFELIDHITEETLADLAAPGAAEDATAPRSVTSLSTTSEDAYRHYLEGRDHQRKYFLAEARESYRHALGIDSTFAMTHLRLTTVESTPIDVRRRAMQAAVRHIDRVTERERLYIRASAAALLQNDPKAAEGYWSRVLDKHPEDKIALNSLADAANGSRDFKRAIDLRNRILAVDPMDKNAHNNLAYSYLWMGDVDNAMRSLDRYIEIAPDEPNPHDTRGDVYAAIGDLDGAIASYLKSTEIKPDFADYASVEKLGHGYVFKGEYEEAEATYRRMFESKDPNVRTRGRNALIGLLSYRGRFSEAIEQIDAALARDELEGVAAGDRPWKRLTRGYLLFQRGDVEQGRESHLDVLDSWPDDTVFNRAAPIWWLARMGLVEEAQTHLTLLEADEDSMDSNQLAFLKAGRGILAMETGNFELAAAELEYVAKFRRHFFYKIMLANAYLLAQRWDNAIRVLENINGNYANNRINENVLASRLHYHMAVAYEAKGRNDEAIAQFEKFLSIREPGDVNKFVRDARKRLEVLKRNG